MHLIQSLWPFLLALWTGPFFLWGCSDTSASASLKNLASPSDGCEPLAESSSIRIGALVSTEQEREAVLAGLAVANAQAPSGIGYQLFIEETAKDQDKALAGFEKLAEKCVRIIVGPATSASLERVMVRANTERIAIISPASTIETLGNRDNVFRLPPADEKQVEFMMGSLEALGVDSYSLIFRKDVWGMGLSQLMHFSGNRPRSALGYDTKLNDFKNFLQFVESDLSKDASNGGIIVAGFDEVAELLLEASKGKQPQVSKAQWLSFDGFAESAVIFEPEYSEALEFALQGDFLAVGPSACGNVYERYSECLAELNNKSMLRHRFYDVAYLDAVVLAAKALNLLLEQSYDFKSEDWLEQVTTRLVEAGKGLSNCLGPVVFNEEGDNQSATFSLYELGPNDWSRVPATAPACAGESHGDTEKSL